MELFQDLKRANFKVKPRFTEREVSAIMKELSLGVFYM